MPQAGGRGPPERESAGQRGSRAPPAGSLPAPGWAGREAAGVRSPRGEDPRPPLARVLGRRRTLPGKGSPSWTLAGQLPDLVLERFTRGRPGTAPDPPGATARLGACQSRRLAGVSSGPDSRRPPGSPLGRPPPAPAARRPGSPRPPAAPPRLLSRHPQTPGAPPRAARAPLRPPHPSTGRPRSRLSRRTPPGRGTWGSRSCTPCAAAPPSSAAGAPRPPHPAPAPSPRAGTAGSSALGWARASAGRSAHAPQPTPRPACLRPAHAPPPPRPERQPRPLLAPQLGPDPAPNLGPSHSMALREL